MTGRIAKWLRDHPWVLTAFFIGVLLGAAICLPLVPFELPESSATLLGAALGAFVAVWGAAWVSDSKDLRERRRQLAVLSLGGWQVLYDLMGNLRVNAQFAEELLAQSRDEEEQAGFRNARAGHLFFDADLDQLTRVAGLVETKLGRELLSTVHSVRTLNSLLKLVVPELVDGVANQEAAELLEGVVVSHRTLLAVLPGLMRSLEALQGPDFRLAADSEGEPVP